MSEDLMMEALGTLQNLDVSNFMDGLYERLKEVGAYQDDGVQESSRLLKLLFGCPVIVNIAVTTAFLEGDWRSNKEDGTKGLCITTSFMRQGTVQSDRYASVDRYGMVVQCVLFLEITCVVLLGIAWVKATLKFRTNLADLSFPSDIISSEIVVDLIKHAFKRTFKTIVTREKDRKWDKLDLSTQGGCVCLLQNNLNEVLDLCCDKEKRDRIEKAWSMQEPVNNRAGQKNEAVKESKEIKSGVLCQWAFGEMVGARKDGVVVSCKFENCRKTHLPSLRGITLLEATTKASNFTPVLYREAVMKGIDVHTESFRRPEGGSGRGGRGGRVGRGRGGGRIRG
jgi:hypothetical protein